MGIPQEDRKSTVFEYPFEVRQQDVDQFDRITSGALYGFMQDAALAHSAARGLSGPEMFEMGYAWMLNRILIAVDTPPKLMDTLRVKTWGSTLTGLYAIREFHVVDEDDTILARGTSRWITIHLGKERPVRLPEALEARYGTRDERGIDDPFEKLKIEADAEHASEFTVHWSHLDSNRHANSAFYFDWIVDGLPVDLLEHGRLRAFELEYKKELLHGDHFTSHWRELESGDGRAFEHVLRRDDDLITQARTRWEMSG